MTDSPDARTMTPAQFAAAKRRLRIDDDMTRLRHADIRALDKMRVKHPDLAAEADAVNEEHAR